MKSIKKFQQPELPPLKPIFDMDTKISNINKKLISVCVPNKTLIELIDVKHMHRTWITYEFYGTANYYEIKNNTKTKKSCSITYRDYDDFEALTFKHMQLQQKWRNEYEQI
tara:strand:+ start:101 stop:433 length:333 start_codon:yes stop_codon:yes gene_type:complete